MSKTASIHTLGCRLNQSEAAIIEDRLREAGYAIVPFGQPCGLGIINTCTVTGEADAKSRKMIRSFIRKNPEAFTAAIGCYSEVGHAALAAIKGVDLILGSSRKLNVLDYVAQGKNDRPLIVRDEIARDDFSIDVTGTSEVSRRANLKIQDGCDFMCSYCIVPDARGRSRSRRLDNILEEAELLALRGAREIVLSGLNLGTYSFEGLTILDVVNRLNEIKGIARIRISSIDMTTVPEGLFEAMSDPHHALVPFLHIPLQSGSDRILKAMNRKYSRGPFLDFIRNAAKSVEDLCIGTDILAGFPGEEEQDFEDTCSLLEEGPLAYAHVFKYSERKGTRAAAYPGKVDPRVINLRSARIRKISAAKWAKYQTRFLGQTSKVLFEHKEQDQWLGYTENYLRVAASSGEDLRNVIRPVRLEKIAGELVQGHITND